MQRGNIFSHEYNPKASWKFVLQDKLIQIERIFLRHVLPYRFRGKNNYKNIGRNVRSYIFVYEIINIFQIEKAQSGI